MSKTGSMVKFVDYNLPKLQTTYTNLNVRVRKIYVAGAVKIFYQVSNEGQYGTKTASVDLIELEDIIKAVEALVKDAEADAADNPDYLENKYVLQDGGNIGYLVNKGKLTWYFTLEKYGRDNTVFLKSMDGLRQSLIDGRSKIQSLTK